MHRKKKIISELLTSFSIRENSTFVWKIHAPILQLYPAASQETERTILP